MAGLELLAIAMELVSVVAIVLDWIGRLGRLGQVGIQAWLVPVAQVIGAVVGFAAASLVVT